MFSGSDMVIFSNDPDADRVLMQKLMGLKAMDAGHGWTIYAMPPAEIAVHPIDGPVRHELHMMCDDIDDTRKRLAELGLESKPAEDLGYGLVSSFEMPGGSTIGFYQPRHERAI